MIGTRGDRPGGAATYDAFLRCWRTSITTIKWAGPVVTIALAAAWWWSGRYWATYVGPGDWTATVAAGLVGVSHEPGLIAMTEQATGVPVPQGLRIVTKSHDMAWWFRVTWEPGRKAISVPLWCPLVIAAGVSAAAWRSDLAARRRARAGCCAACGYNRTGLAPQAPCPECGGRGLDAPFGTTSLSQVATPPGP